MRLSSTYESGDKTYKLILKQTCKFNVEILGDLNNIDTKIFILKEELIENNIYYEVIELYDNIEYTYQYIEDLILEEGVYYIGYTNLIQSIYCFDFYRKVTDYGEEKLNVDTNEYVKCGSHISVLEKDEIIKSYNQTYIYNNFTRIIYINQNLLQNISRLDYYWYSSDETIATVSCYGTVLAKNIGQVNIMAVLKSDPSKCYIKTFDIIDDSNINEITIDNEYHINYISSEYENLLDLTTINCPYPLIRLYNWTISNNENDIDIIFDNYGYLKVNKIGSFYLTGNYKNNTNINVRIHIIIK